MVYQSFWTLTASKLSFACLKLGSPHLLLLFLLPDPRALQHPAILGPSKRLGITAEQTFYQYCIQEGITPLNGTTNEERMKLGVEVLQGRAGTLRDGERASIREILV